MAGRRDRIKMTDEEVDAFLHERQTLNVATFGPDGRVHLVAMWYGFVNGNPAFETFTKSQKVLNLQRDDRVTCLIEDGDDYSTLRGVELVGRAVVHDDQEMLLDLAVQVVQRYYGVDDLDQARELAEVVAKKRVTIEVIPDKIVSWDHRKLGVDY
jgi:PPOX class probable F420-dependent enzyme